MTVLVTGGAGFVGSHVALALIDAGEQVVVLDDLSSGHAAAVPQTAALVVGDIGDVGLVDRLLLEYRPDAIIHLAAHTIVSESAGNPLRYYANNTVKACMLFEAAVRGGVRHIVFSSTAAVYGAPDTSPVDEAAATYPINPYGRSKLMAEWMLADAGCAHGFHYAILRYFNVAGADPQGRSGQSTPEATHLIKVACQVALGQRPHLVVFGTDYPTRDGSCVRDYIQVTDLAEAHIMVLAALRRGRDSLVLNCGYGLGYSVFEVVEAVRRASGVDFEVRIGSRRPGDPAEIVADVGRIRRELSWQPRFADLDTIVAQALRWERSLIRRRPVHPESSR